MFPVMKTVDFYSLYLDLSLLTVITVLGKQYPPRVPPHVIEVSPGSPALLELLMALEILVCFPNP